MRYIEKHLAEVGGALLPGSVWTGWSSALVDELDPLHGSAAHDGLEGSGNADIVFGHSGNDTAFAFGGDDYLIGGAGRDALFGGSGNDKVDGGTGADRLHGGIGADLLTGGEGADHLYAGIDDNRDRIVYGSEAELLATDKIFHFDFRGSASELVWDRIDLRSIDADQKNGDQAFRFVEAFSAAGAGESDGQLRVVGDGADAVVEIDFNGDNAADAFIIVRHVPSLSQDDFLL
jgi:Ca2+-binding RTX toxin-like protein